MIWNKLFAKGEILTQGDREELEALEKKAEPYRKIRERIEKDFIPAMHRIGHLQGLAGQLVQDIQNEDLYQRMLICACMPSNLQTGYQHLDAAKHPFDEKIEQVLLPSIDVVRRVLKRALSRAEDELKKTEAKERKEAETEGFPYSPSGRVQALQTRVLELRNGIAAQYRHEGAIQGPGPWQERLKEWL